MSAIRRHQEDMRASGRKPPGRGHALGREGLLSGLLASCLRMAGRSRYEADETVSQAADVS